MSNTNCAILSSIDNSMTTGEITRRFEDGLVWMQSRSEGFPFNALLVDRYDRNEQRYLITVYTDKATFEWAPEWLPFMRMDDIKIEWKRHDVQLFGHFPQ